MQTYHPAYTVYCYEIMTSNNCVIMSSVKIFIGTSVLKMSMLVHMETLIELNRSHCYSKAVIARHYFIAVYAGCI